MTYILIFFLLFILDLAWSFYLNNVKEGNAASSASWAAFLYLLGASATISWVAQPTLLIPAALGAFAGTYTGVWWNKRKENK